MKSTPSVAGSDDDLGRILDYWQQLRRGENSIPFSDDINLASLSDMASHTLLIEVFNNPLRFRVDIAGARVEEQYGDVLAGRFLHELASQPPLDELADKCQLVVNKRTFCHEIRGRGDRQYARLTLPFWGNGHIDMLLVGIVSRQTQRAAS
jgi:hypothetical protein